MTQSEILRAYDRIDAVAGAVQYWLDRMARNTDRAEADRKEDLLQAELDKFMDQTLGRPQSSPSVLSNYQGFARGR